MYTCICIHASQVAAARSLGLSGYKTYRHIIVPQAIRQVIPPLLGFFIALQKDSALVLILGLMVGLAMLPLLILGVDLWPIIVFRAVSIAIIWGCLNKFLPNRVWLWRRDVAEEFLRYTVLL